MPTLTTASNDNESADVEIVNSYLRRALTALGYINYQGCVESGDLRAAGNILEAALSPWAPNGSETLNVLERRRPSHEERAVLNLRIRNFKESSFQRG